MKFFKRNDTIDLAATANGAALHLTTMQGYSISAVWTDAGSLGGSFKLQGSNNAFTDNVNNNENSSATWVDVVGSSVAVSGASSQLWNVSDVYYGAARVVWTRTGGSGTYTSVTIAKSVY